MSHRLSVADVRLSDFTDRLTNRPILATTAMYGPWMPQGMFDFGSYEVLVRDVLESGSVPATNVDTTWAQYNTWDLARQIIGLTARVAQEFADRFSTERPLLVVGLSTNADELRSYEEIAPCLRRKIQDVQPVLKEAGVQRVRYMPIPDRRLLGADTQTKVRVYQDIGRVVGDFTDHGMVFFELDIGIPDFGSDFDAETVGGIIEATPQIQEYKSAIIARKPGRWSYDYDFRDDLVRIALVEQVAPQRVQFSTGNDWCIALARLGANLPRFGYLLGASQMSPKLFERWRLLIERDDPSAIPLEQDLQAAARDFWTPGNVGIYRHYVGIFLALTGRIAHANPHPECAPSFRVRPEDYWRPLKHALRLGLMTPEVAVDRARAIIPGAINMAGDDLEKKIRLMG
jgi:hypothetical protein